MWYKLDEDKKPVPCSSLDLDFDHSNRRVANDELEDGSRVSTVFLALDHGFGGPPLFFETMVFSKDSFRDRYCRRYETWEQAEEGHKEILAAFKDGTLELYDDGNYGDNCSEADDDEVVTE